MSAVMPVKSAGPGLGTTAPPRAAEQGFFAHHGVWAPGVRLFRHMRFTAKAVVISLAFMVPMLGLVSWLLKTQADQALASRMQATQQQVQMAHRLLVWARGQELGGALTRDQAQRFTRQAVAALGQDIWLRGGAEDGVALADTAASAPHPQGQGFVTHGAPGGTAAARVSYVQDFEPWGWTVGAAVPLAELRTGPARQLLGAGGILLLTQLIAGYLFLSFYRVMDGGLRMTRRHLRAMTEGDLTTSPRPWGQDESAQLMLELCRMQDSLRHMVRRVRSASGRIVQASDGIASGAADLSTRTEHAASALQQSSLSMERIAATAQRGAKHTEEASGVARHNADLAADGGRVMREVVDTMDGIRNASARIGEIVATIDGIAFQTNILALNAAVEAARAGTQGVGFAVVANEVRMLAQRSAAAAKEIKALIGGSVEQVQAGTVVVRKAGVAMHDIVAASQRVNQLLGEVALGAREQSLGIGQVGQAVVELDRMTQQNASLVDRTASSASDMRELAQTLAAEVARFRMPAHGV